MRQYRPMVVCHQLTEMIMDTSITKLNTVAGEQTILDAEPSEAATAPTTGPGGKFDKLRTHTRKRAAQGRAPDGRSPVSATAGSKTEIVLKKLKAAKGATLPMLMEATGRQAHSVRGFLSGTVRR